VYEGEIPEEQSLADMITTSAQKRLSIKEYVGSPEGAIGTLVDIIHGPEETFGESRNGDMNPQRTHDQILNEPEGWSFRAPDFEK